MRVGSRLALLVYLVLVVRTAWISDDALITFRTVRNVLDGYGLVWNVGERVQAYTHPLWMLLLTVTYAPLREPLLAALLLSLLCSALTAGVVAERLAATPAAALAGMAALALSRAFVDFSSSGLENPLTHLLLALFFLVFLAAAPTPRRPFLLALLAALLALSRSDALLLVAPALAAEAWRVRRGRALVFAALGFAPLAVWTLFSLFYYGFPVPNTAYAKLNTGIPAGELAAQGLLYLVESLGRDPVTLTFILIGVVAALASGERVLWPLAVGIMLYLAYVVRIGGDFMSGRFLTAPLLCSVIALVCSRRFVIGGGAFAALGVALLLGIGAGSSALGIDRAALDTQFSPQGVADERGYYFARRGLLNQRRPDLLAPEAADGSPPYGALVGAGAVFVANADALGGIGYDSPPDAYIVDPLALSDPLLARLPAFYDPFWRVGHYRRTLPNGYIETLASGENQLADTALAAYYDQLRLITRGPLLDPARLGAIVELNLGRYEALIDREAYRYPGRLAVTHTRLEAEGQAPLQVRDAGGVLVDLEAQRTAPQIEMVLSRGFDYRLVYLRDGRALAEQRVAANALAPEPLALFRISVPPVARAGYDALWLFPLRAGDQAQVASVRLLEPADEPALSLQLAAGWQADEQRPWFWGRSPATLLIASPRRQQARLHFTPAVLPNSDGRGRARSGTLVVRRSDGAASVVEVEAGREAMVMLSLEAGWQTFTIEPQVRQQRSPGELAFALEGMRLEPAELQGQ
jgi:arabinofuranosyltransferase